MMTNQRRYEIIEACKSLIASQNVTDYGKINAQIKIDEVYRDLLILGD